ncbi:hypothetical protein B0H67DRAFT_556207 [Lasiosphaeris hirsuta]|uniref:Uncharacterized protein n=1 Tax=Lasiosphaeris hirsuta TaxID=260670 RepID=A0AA40DLF2_9PEZI|nr:hypothetical protein B0H67DRAFT_556207 [Lasiosphaeris hirsuta]
MVALAALLTFLPLALFAHACPLGPNSNIRVPPGFNRVIFADDFGVQAPGSQPSGDIWHFCDGHSTLAGRGTGERKRSRRTRRRRPTSSSCRQAPSRSPCSGWGRRVRIEAAVLLSAAPSHE